VLALEFIGDGSTQVTATELALTLQNDLAQIAFVEERFDEFAAAHSMPKDVKNKMGVIFDDLLNNIISYGYTDSGEHEIGVRVRLRDGRLYRHHLG